MRTSLEPSGVVCAWSSFYEETVENEVKSVTELCMAELRHHPCSRSYQARLSGPKPYAAPALQPASIVKTFCAWLASPFAPANNSSAANLEG